MVVVNLQNGFFVQGQLQVIIRFYTIIRTIQSIQVGSFPGDIDFVASFFNSGGIKIRSASSIVPKVVNTCTPEFAVTD